MERIHKGHGNSDSTPFCSISCRRVLNIMVFLGFMVNYMVRVNLTFAIVDMIQTTTKNATEIKIPIHVNRTRRSVLDKFISHEPSSLLNTSTHDVKLSPPVFNMSTHGVKLSPPVFNMSTHDVKLSPPVFNMSTHDVKLSPPVFNLSTHDVKLSPPVFNLSTHDVKLSPSIPSMPTHDVKLSLPTLNTSTHDTKAHNPIAVKVVDVTRTTSSEEIIEEEDIYYYSDEYTYRTSSEEAQDNNKTYDSIEETTPISMKSTTLPPQPDPINHTKSQVDPKTTENPLSREINNTAKNISQLYIKNINRVVNKNGKNDSNDIEQELTTTTKNYDPSTENLSKNLERTLNPKLNLGSFNNKNNQRIASSFSKMTSIGVKPTTGTKDGSLDKNNISEYLGDSNVIYANEPTEGNEIPSDSLISNETLSDEPLVTDGSAEAAAAVDTDAQYIDEEGTVRFGWTEAQKGYLIGSFFAGYVCTEIPGGRLSEMIGPRKVFGYAMAGASFVTVLTPFFAKIGLNYVIVLRVILGLFIGPTWPAVLPLAAKWIPPNERGKFMSNMMGSTLGAAITTPMCGFIISAFNWEYVFYVTGLIGIVWSIFWFLLVFDTPRQHPRITQKEMRFIESQLAEDVCIPLKCLNETDHNSDEEELQEHINSSKTNGTEGTSNEEQRLKSEVDGEETEELKKDEEYEKTREDEKDEEYGKVAKYGKEEEEEEETTEEQIPTQNDNLSLSTKPNSNVKRRQSDASLSKVSKVNSHPSAPWLKILSSIPVWAFVLTHSASIFGYNTIINQLPTYASNILHYNIKQNGFVSALPYLGKYIMALTAGSLADSLLKSGRLSKTATKKLFTGFGVMIPGILMIFQVYLGQHDVIAIAIFTFSLTANGMITGGYLGNSLDLAPNYSGTIFGLGNMCSSSTGGISALLVGYLTTKNPEDFTNWQIVFWITGIIYIFGSLIFIFFGSTDVQPWNSVSSKKVSTSQPVKSS